jgi:hypothetical protein
MDKQQDNKDLSTSLLWTLFVPIDHIDEKNRQAVITWLEDRSHVLIWFTSIVTSSIVLLTLFGNKPGLSDANSIALFISLLLMFFSILCNLVCVWQIPKWKLAIQIGRVSHGSKMALDIELSSLAGLLSFLGALVMAVIGNSM